MRTSNREHPYHHRVERSNTVFLDFQRAELQKAHQMSLRPAVPGHTRLLRREGLKRKRSADLTSYVIFCHPSSIRN
jgi:hypothetical protein